MTEKEWLLYFSIINNREATAAELEEGLARGEFQRDPAPIQEQAQQPAATKTESNQQLADQAAPLATLNASPATSTFPGFHSIKLGSQASPPVVFEKKPKPGKKWLWLGLSLLILLLGLAIGTGRWFYQTGDIEGTWEIQSQYGAIDDDGVDKSYVFKAKQSKYSNYLIVDKNNQVSYVGLLKASQQQDQDLPNIYPSEYMDNQVRVDQWRKQFVPTMSSEDYDQYLTNQINGPLENYYKTRFYSDDIEDAKAADKKAWLKAYKNFTGKKYAYRREYERDGDSLIVKFIDKNGKTVVTQHCKRLSTTKADKVNATYKQEIKTFERYYKINS